MLHFIILLYPEGYILLLLYGFFFKSGVFYRFLECKKSLKPHKIMRLERFPTVFCAVQGPLFSSPILIPSKDP